MAGPGELVTGPGTSVEVSVWPWEWAKSPLPGRLLRWRSLLMSLWLIYASGAILSLRQHSPGKLTPVHKGNMCESARRLLSCLVLVLLLSSLATWRDFFPWSGCVSYSESSQEGSKQNCEGSGAAGERDGGADRQTSLKTYKSWTHKAVGPLRAREREKEEMLTRSVPLNSVLKQITNMFFLFWNSKGSHLSLWFNFKVSTASKVSSLNLYFT